MSERLPTLLIIDDDLMMRTLLLEQLKQCGYPDCIAVDSGQAGLAQVLAHASSIEVIVLDLNMPDMDGVEFIRKLPQHRFAGSVVLVSGADDRVLQSVGQLVRSLGIKLLGSLRKPVQPGQLRTLMKTLVSGISASTIRAGYRHPWSTEEVRRAVQQHELVLHYQPLVALATGQVRGVEALVRWAHPEHGLIPPDQFIPVAEETGVIRDITRFVLAEVTRQVQTWAAEGINLAVAVNVSIDDLDALDFPDMAAATAVAAGVDPACITLEVSEHQVIQHQGTALDVLSRLKLKGFRLAIDDFGTGYASLAQLRDLPFDEMKIDRSFVHKSPNSAKLRAICAASIRMAHELKMSVVAEGIETLAEWRLLRRLGCEIGQGYGIARPMAAELVPQWCSGVASADRPGSFRLP